MSENTAREKIKKIKLKYCHNREAVKAIEEACDILNEFGQ